MGLITLKCNRNWNALMRKTVLCYFLLIPFHMPISLSSILIFIVFVVHHNVKSIDTIEWATRVFILPLYLCSFALFVFMTWSIQRWRSKLNPILRNYPQFSPTSRSAYKPETHLFNAICIRHSSFSKLCSYKSHI